MYYWQWKAELMEKQRKLYNKIAVVLAVLGFSAASIGIFEVIRRIP